MSDSKTEDVRGCVSFSLYGDESLYAAGAVENVALAREFYPGWECRVYLEAGHYARRSLIEAGANVIDMGKSDGSSGMFWRFLACDDPSFTHVIVRDADSRINPRDQACVLEWIESGKYLHVIKDNHWHHEKAVIGGAWGMKTGSLLLGPEVEVWPNHTNYGDDEEFLHWKVWEHFRPTDDFLLHDYACGAGNKPIPSHAPFQGHVCERVPFKFEMSGKWEALVLSPPKFTNRRRMFYDRLRDYGGFLVNNVIWQPGVEAHEVDIPKDFPHADEHPHYYLNTTDHHNVFREAVDKDLDYLFVFEDDAYIEDGFDDFLARALMCIPDGWLAIQLGGQEWSDHNRGYFTKDGAHAHENALARVFGCLGQHGVLWNREGLKEALHFFTTQRPNQTIDQAFAEWQGRDHRFYSCWTWAVKINPNTEQYGRGT